MLETIATKMVFRLVFYMYNDHFCMEKKNVVKVLCGLKKKMKAGVVNIIVQSFAAGREEGMVWG